MILPVPPKYFSVYNKYYIFQFKYGTVVTKNANLH